MTTPRLRADNRAIEIQRAGFSGTHILAKGDEIKIGCRAPCGAYLRVPLTGPIPECSVSCACTTDAKRRAKMRRAG